MTDSEQPDMNIQRRYKSNKEGSNRRGPLSSQQHLHYEPLLLETSVEKITFSSYLLQQKKIASQKGDVTEAPRVTELVFGWLFCFPQPPSLLPYFLCPYHTIGVRKYKKRPGCGHICTRSLLVILFMCSRRRKPHPRSKMRFQYSNNSQSSLSRCESRDLLIFTITYTGLEELKVFKRKVDLLKAYYVLSLNIHYLTVTSRSLSLGPR